MVLAKLLSVPVAIGTLIASRLSPILPAALSRGASTMVIESSKLNVLHGPLQPITRDGDTTHPAGYARDGYCWGISDDPGRHFIGAVVTQEFLDFSKNQGNNLITRRPGFPGLKEGCKWCLCVQRWHDAFKASETLGNRVVPKVDLSATALGALQQLKLDDLKRFEYRPMTSSGGSSTRADL